MVLFFISVVFLITNYDKEQIVIPQEAIRYRIIANSNSFQDQEQKLFVNTLIEPVLKEILVNSKNISESRQNIISNIPKIENLLTKQKIRYDLNYGLNYFPKKNYRDVLYNEGNYESLVITLGEGLGNNWWCCLFPPLCLIEAQESKLDDITYSFYLKDIINKYL